MKEWFQKKRLKGAMVRQRFINSVPDNAQLCCITHIFSFDAQMWSLCVMLTQTYFQRSRRSTASRRTEFRKRNRVCLIRFLPAVLVGSNVTSGNSVAMLIGWKFTSFPRYLYRFGRPYYYELGWRVRTCARLRNLNFKKIYLCRRSQWQTKKLFHRRNSGNPAAYTCVPDSAQLKPDLASLPTASDSSFLVFVLRVICGGRCAA